MCPLEWTLMTALSRPVHEALMPPSSRRVRSSLVATGFFPPAWRYISNSCSITCRGEYSLHVSVSQTDLYADVDSICFQNRSSGEERPIYGGGGFAYYPANRSFAGPVLPPVDPGRDQRQQAPTSLHHPAVIQVTARSTISHGASIGAFAIVDDAISGPQPLC